MTETREGKMDKEWCFTTVNSPSIVLTQKMFLDSMKKIYKISPGAPWIRKELKELLNIKND